MTTPSEIGRYKILGELGRGAMGVVYRAVDPALDRAVAIKVISGQQAAGADISELEARFLREAKIAARINHPGVVTVFDAGRAGDSLFLVMELIEGESLSQRISRKEYPPVAESFKIAAQAAEALAAAHAMGVVHRDIKPANIMLTRDGRVKVADFGVAKAIGEGTELTRTGTVVGSPAYMAPEQVRGQTPDGRADLFSLGVVLYELLLHRKPFPADTITSLIYQILHEDPLVDPTTAAALDRRVEEFIRRALAKEPDGRFPDGMAFAAAAREIVARMPEVQLDSTEVTRVVPAQQGAAPAKKPAAAGPPVAWLAVGGVAALVVVAVVVALLVRKPNPTTAAQAAQAAVPTAVAGVPIQVRPGGEPTWVAEETPAAVDTPYPVETAPSGDEPLGSRFRLRLGPKKTEPPAPAPDRERVAQGSTPGVTNGRPVARVEPTSTPEPIPVFECRRGANFNVSPEKALVEINGEAIGTADDWDGALFGKLGKSYLFPAPGIYFARLSAPGRRTTLVKIIVRPEAPKDIVSVKTKLAKTGTGT